MKHKLKLIFILLIFGCNIKENRDIMISCEKSFLFDEYNEVKYYYILKIKNQTKKDIYLTDKGIFLYKNKIEKDSLSFKLNDQYLTSPFIQLKHRGEVWKIEPNETIKQLYSTTNSSKVKTNFILVVKNDKVLDSLKIPNYIVLKESMTFERALIEVDGTLNILR